MPVCDMRGFLSFLILWLLNKQPMTGTQLADEIGERKGYRPNPGTIYPALKSLLEKKVIKSKASGKEKIYSLTKQGELELQEAKNLFCKTFYDIVSK